MSVAAAGQYSYAITNDGVYSWGMGENYVLGNRDDCNEFFPYKLDPRMFENNPAVAIGCGTQHTVVLTLDSPDSKIPELNLAAWEAALPTSAPQKVEEDEPVDEEEEEQEQKEEEPEVAVPVNNGGFESTTVIEPPSESKKRAFEEVVQHEQDIINSQAGVKRLKIDSEHEHEASSYQMNE